MVMEDPMEDMVDIEAMEAMAMEREMLKLSQDMVMVDMVMAMEDLMEVMVDTEAMVDMDMERERLRLNLVMDTVVMVMEDLMGVMVDAEAMDMAVMAMESNFNPTISKHCRLKKH